MEADNSRPLVIFHAECLDGIVSAYVVWLHYRGHADYCAAVYGSVPPDVQGRRVIIVDFSYPPEVLETMAAVASHITMIDHHDSAVRKYERWAGRPNVEVLFDLTRSGAALTQQFFMVMAESWIVDYAEDRDLWRFELPQSREISAYLSAITLGKEPHDAFAALLQVSGVPFAKVAVLGAGALEQLQAYCRQVTRSASRVRFAGHEGIPLANIARPMNSDVLNMLAVGELFSVGWYQEGDEAIFSLRAAKDFNVARLAERFGGGGHPLAAGFRVPFVDAVRFIRGEVGADESKAQ